MSTSTSSSTTKDRPAVWRSALPRSQAMTLAATEYTRFAEQLRRLSGSDWSRPTGCPGWDVRAMAGHVTGMAEMSASIAEQVRQMRAAGRAKGEGELIDAMTALQVAKHAGRTAEELVARFEAVAPKAARGRRRIPGLVRRFATTTEKVGEAHETWAMGYLVDVVLTRDTWMHRMDIARAVGQEPHLTADHDGVLVADVVAEWARRHGRPCTLTLTGTAGGSWSWGTGGPHLQEDAVDFCRGLSGRGPAALDTAVPF